MRVLSIAGFLLLAATLLAAVAARAQGDRSTVTPFPGVVSDYHGYICHDFLVDGCAAKVVEPKMNAPGRPWIWRAMFWDAFPEVDLAMLEKGCHLAYIGIGNTFGCPDALKHWDVFYTQMTDAYGLSRYPALEGLSRGGLYIYRWASAHPDKVGCLFGDAPVCDFKSWPGGKGRSPGSPDDWAKLIRDYHFGSEAEALAFTGNPTDERILRPIADAHIPIVHLVGDIDKVVPPEENTDILRTRYLALGGSFFEVVKHGCDHHPHGLPRPQILTDFLLVHTGKKPGSKKTAAHRSGEILTLSPEQWQ